MIEETINQRIFHYRKLRGITQLEMAQKMGMKHSTYSQLERKGKINTDSLLKIAQILNIDATVLLYGNKAQENKTEPLAESKNIKEGIAESEELVDDMGKVRRLEGWEIGFLKTLYYISPIKRNALHRLNNLVLNNRKLDIIKIVEDIENRPEIKRRNI